MTAIFVYGLALLAGIVAKFVYGIIYGFIYSIFPTTIILKLLPKSISKHHSKLYLHLLWISGEFISTLVVYIVLSRFDLAMNWIFIFLLCINPVFVLNSKLMRKPENLGYFNLIYQTENAAKNMSHQIVIINRMEGISRIIGLFLCLYIV